MALFLWPMGPLADVKEKNPKHALPEEAQLIPALQHL